MTAIETAFTEFDAAWERVDYDLKVYSGKSEDDPDETDVDKKRELVESLRLLGNAAFALAVELNSGQ